MPNSPHRIRRQSWLVRADSASAAFNLRQRLRDDWQGLLLPAFERAFDKEFSGEDVIHIAHIRLGLQLGSEKEVSRLPELIQHHLVRRLREIAFARPYLNERSVQCKTSTQRQDRLETLLQYLRTGSVPWEAAGNSISGLAAELQETCREQWPEVQKCLLGERLSVAFHFRLLQLIAPSETDRAARALLEGIPLPQKEPVLQLLAALLESGKKHFGRYTQLQLSALLLSEVIARREDWTAPDFVLVARRALPFESKRLDKFISSLPAPVAALFQELKPGGMRSSGNLTGGAGFQADMAAVEAKIGAKKGKSLIPQVNSGPAQKKKSLYVPVQSAEASAFSSKGDENFPAMVAHVGLILLHPFLPRFFESTGVKVKANPRLSPFVLPRACALLHFLATGRDAIYEYEVSFIKVMLGIDLETSLCVTEGLVTEADKLEAEALLEATITHWAALKSTSIASFRNSFLERPALLREEDDGWRLQVERQPFDVLLEHLPWSISVVKLPWMQRPIYTEW